MRSKLPCRIKDLTLICGWIWTGFVLIMRQLVLQYVRTYHFCLFKFPTLKPPHLVYILSICLIQGNYPSKIPIFPLLEMEILHCSPELTVFYFSKQHRMGHMSAFENGIKNTVYLRIWGQCLPFKADVCACSEPVSGIKVDGCCGRSWHQPLRNMWVGTSTISGRQMLYWQCAGGWSGCNH